MNKTNISRLLSCTNTIPTCLTEAPNTSLYRTTSLLMPLCKGKKISKMMYHYNYCDKEFIGQQRTSYALSCHCITNTITDCRPYMFGNDKCNIIFISLLTIQLLVIVIGVILNSIVIAQYLKFSSIRKRLAHILLLNQAVADLVNCLVYLTPLIVTHFHNVTYREYPNILDPLFGSAAFLSFSSSLYLFLIIAIERYISIVQPFWHRIMYRGSIFIDQ